MPLFQGRAQGRLGGQQQPQQHRPPTSYSDTYGRPTTSAGGYPAYGGGGHHQYDLEQFNEEDQEEDEDEDVFAFVPGRGIASEQEPPPPMTATTTTGGRPGAPQPPMSSSPSSTRPSLSFSFSPPLQPPPTTPPSTGTASNAHSNAHPGPEDYRLRRLNMNTAASTAVSSNNQHNFTGSPALAPNTAGTGGTGGMGQGRRPISSSRSREVMVHLPGRGVGEDTMVVEEEDVGLGTKDRAPSISSVATTERSIK
ncbi:hypothetical protein M378DRAFT_560182 [Amanita muscaria Koide BX008]|uniref:Uncharacterized protein n=1 Tax=Amanita muscaria (strain Koide BX008) TaxID=946122 RepID=A0A0C2SPF0_AMAMK|nr:hypothetical protein M378DRAFT_560182 [Amanita muscaria Koide BX008]